MTAARQDDADRQIARMFVLLDRVRAAVSRSAALVEEAQYLQRHVSETQQRVHRRDQDAGTYDGARRPGELRRSAG